VGTPCSFFIQKRRKTCLTCVWPSRFFVALDVTESLSPSIRAVIGVGIPHLDMLRTPNLIVQDVTSS
jgi:hypothetical protein